LPRSADPEAIATKEETMKRRSPANVSTPARRRMLKQTAALGAAAIAAPYVIRSANAQAAADIGPYTQ
jgi:hypothetical protein